VCSCVLERARAHSSERCGNSKKASAAVGMLASVGRYYPRISPAESPATARPDIDPSVSVWAYPPLFVTFP